MIADAAVLNSPEVNKLTGKAMIIMRTVTLVIMALLFMMFVNAVPLTYDHLMDVCDSSVASCSWAQPTPENVQTLADWGVSLAAFAVYHLIVYTLSSLVMWTLAVLIFWHRSDEWFSYVVIYLLTLFGAGGVSLVFADSFSKTIMPQVIQVMAEMTVIPAYLFFSLFLLTFPDGRFFPKRSAWVMVLILLNYGVWLAPANSPMNILNWSPLMAALWLVFVFGSHIAVQIIRYRRYYQAAQRQQSKWLIYGFSMSLLILLVAGGLEELLFSGMLEGTLVALLFMPIPISVGIAIFAYQLWDIDIIINRTFVYGALTAIVVGLYVLIISVLSAIFQTSGHFLISLAGTGIVAVLFHPLREWLQRMVDRFVFGERSNPYAVISRLSQRLESNVSPNTLLPGIAETIAQALKLPYVAIALKMNEQLQTQAVYGQPANRGRITVLPLSYANETVGELIIGQVAGDKELDGTERQLLENIAQQTGVAVHAVQLTRALQQSRQQIITAREEERRRLRRDLHDGLGPALAAHTIKIGAARSLLERNPQTATKILNELETNLADSLSDIRRLVYNLRPPALDQLGLVGALNDFIQQCNQPGSEIDTAFVLDVSGLLPALPAAVEVAAYRIVQEAVNNVIRHASASRCTVTLALGDALNIHVEDDGVGMNSSVSQGVGLTSMQERAEELGGHFSLSSEHHQGTRIHVRLPL